MCSESESVSVFCVVGYIKYFFVCVFSGDIGYAIRTEEFRCPDDAWDTGRYLNYLYLIQKSESEPVRAALHFVDNIRRSMIDRNRDYGTEIVNTYSPYPSRRTDPKVSCLHSGLGGL